MGCYVGQVHALNSENAMGQGNGAIPFLDTLVTLQADGTLSITVYQKPTHTDQYLQWDSHCSLSAKYSVIGTLTHRARTVCTNPDLLDKEVKHLREVMGKCKYPNWAINKVQSKVLNNNWEENDSNNNKQAQQTKGQGENSTNTTTTRSKLHGTGSHPYTQGTAEGFKSICGKYGIQVHFKGNTTLKQLLMQPKDQDPKQNKSGIIYSYQCTDLACDEEYIGEISRTLGERCKEHLKQASPIHVHIQQTGHTIEDNSFNIIDREDRGQARTIKESIYIRANNPNLNQNIGKYNLSHIWDTVLFNIPGLRLGSSHPSSS